MQISLDTIQDLAPDQASLKAAKKLLPGGKWPLSGQATAANSIWGQCQGSGSNPYMTMADVVDHGYKCTCPSRKFPCKHVLALLWRFANDPADFTEGEPPEWVQEWLRRRRKKNGDEGNTAGTPNAKKNIHLADDTSQPQLSPQEAAKREAARQKRAAQTKAASEAAMRAGVVDLQNWINDQLRAGIGIFLKEVNERCRQIAARLVDAKAANLAARLDELPSLILPLGIQGQAEMAFRQLGQLVLLSEAWLLDPQDPDARRGLGTSENRDQVLDNPHAIRAQGLWEVVGEKLEARKDGLISHASWLLRLDSDDQAPRFALLQDYYPAATGAGRGARRSGLRMQAELVYYPSRYPLRAIIARQEPSDDRQTGWPAAAADLKRAFAQAAMQIPWLEQMPHLLSGGRVVAAGKGSFWWRDADDGLAIRLKNPHLSDLLLGSELTAAFVLYDGAGAELFAAQSARWGLIRGEA